MFSPLAYASCLVKASDGDLKKEQGGKEMSHGY
jgi:hypothetical protein